MSVEVKRAFEITESEKSTAPEEELLASKMIEEGSPDRSEEKKDIKTTTISDLENGLKLVKQLEKLENKLLNNHKDMSSVLDALNYIKEEEEETKRKFDDFYEETMRLMGNDLFSIPISKGTFLAQMTRAESRLETFIINLSRKYSINRDEFIEDYRDYYIREVTLAYCKILLNELQNKSVTKLTGGTVNNYMMKEARKHIEQIELDIEDSYEE